MVQVENYGVAERKNNKSQFFHEQNNNKDRKHEKSPKAIHKHLSMITGHNDRGRHFQMEKRKKPFLGQAQDADAKNDRWNKQKAERTAATLTIMN